MHQQRDAGRKETAGHGAAHVPDADEPDGVGHLTRPAAAGGATRLLGVSIYFPFNEIIFWCEEFYECTVSLSIDATGCHASAGRREAVRSDCEDEQRAIS